MLSSLSVVFSRGPDALQSVAPMRQKENETAGVGVQQKYSNGVKLNATFGRDRASPATRHSAGGKGRHFGELRRCRDDGIQKRRG